MGGMLNLTRDHSQPPWRPWSIPLALRIGFASFRAMRNGAMIENEEGKRIPAEDSVAAWATRSGVHPLAAEGLHSKLSILFHRDYIV
jgi:hypothetical protein